MAYSLRSLGTGAVVYTEESVGKMIHFGSPAPVPEATPQDKNVGWVAPQ